ncbi:MAG: dihydrolipoamide dehydrogenase [Hyphomicrobiales bacterium]|nr:MAG: dihydrolipoamide dehydrogenase [Hyphomicrobiales bacterium]
MAEVLTPDLCVIGAGASGLAVAEAARRLGASVVMVERGETGGMSHKAGALALQALAAAAGKAVAARNGEPFGVFGEPAKVSFRKVHDHIAEIIGRGTGEVAPAKLAAQGIDLIRGIGAFTDPRTVAVGETQIRARRFVIATGAKPVLPDVPGLFSVPYFTTDTIFANTRKLSHLIVIGAGPMGLELALSYRRLGCEVSVIEPGRALPQADPELAAIALRRLREEGVALYEESAIVAVQARSQGIGIVVRNRDEPATLDASHILVAASRLANLADLNLDAAKIRRSKTDPGALSLSASLRTTNPKVWAVGEAAGHAPSPHLGTIEADLVVRAALLGRPSRFDPAAMPRLTLTDPPIAEIGLTEPMARGRFKTGFSVLRAAYAENDSARATRDGMGVVKLIVGRNAQILGAGIVGTAAAELAALFALAIEQKIDAAKLAELAAPYPSYADLARQLGAMAAATAPVSRLDARLFALNRLLR